MDEKQLTENKENKENKEDKENKKENMVLSPSSPSPSFLHAVINSTGSPSKNKKSGIFRNNFLILLVLI